MIDALEVVAAIAAASRSWLQAARLSASADRARHEHGYARGPAATDCHRRLQSTLEAELAEEERVTALAEGDAMPLDAATAYAQRGRGPRRRPLSGWASLTVTERLVADHVAAGLTNPEIAKEMLVARSTVKGHVSNVLSKLGLTSRTELAAEAARRAARGR
jgi:DNA-binding NarL/FixJ family response regulator